MDKTKITQAATKYVQKGQFDKAIAEYRRILQQDPRDVRVLLKIGELQQKKGENEAAAATLLDVANAYASDGFFLKAVAVFKQVLKLSPARVDVTMRLADLYQQLGLMSEAMTQLQAAATHYEKVESIAESVDILRRIVSMEPENLAFRLRLADLLARQERTTDALKELRGAAEKLRGGSRIEDWLRVGDRIVRLDPKDQNLGRELAHAYLAKSDVRRALERLQVCFQEDPKNTETLDLLARAFVGVGQRPKAASVYKELARVYRERSRGADEQAAWRKVLELAPDDAEATQALESFASPGGKPLPPPRAAAAAPAPAALQAAAPASQRPAETPRPAVPAAPPAEGSWSSRPAPPQPEGSWSSRPAPPRAEPSWPAAPRAEPSRPGAAQPPASDPMQLARLLTETDVFVKYGLQDKARAHLDKIFAIDPDNVAAHEKAVALLRGRDEAGLHAALASLARACAKAGEHERGRPHFEELRAAAPSHPELAALAATYASAPALHDISDDLILEGGTGPIDFDPALPGGDEPLLLPIEPGELPVAFDAAEAAGSPDATDAFAPVNDDALFALASDPFDDVVDEPLLGDPDTPARDLQADAFALLDRDADSRGPADEQTIAIDTDADTAGPPPTEQTVDLVLPEGDEELPAMGIDTNGLPAELAAMSDDELLGLTPLARHATDETDEVNFDAATAEHEPLANLVAAARRRAEPGLAPERTPATVAQDPVNPWRVGDGEVPEIVAELDEAEFYLAQGMLDEAEESFRAVERRVPGHAQAVSRLQEIAALRAGPEIAPAPSVPDDAPDHDGLFDLGAALADELGDEPFAQNDAPFQHSLIGAPLPAAQVEDVDTQYNLAIAYKEMGLLAEAVVAFEKALAGCADTARAIDCLTMIGMCHGAMGDHAQAVEAFRKGLAHGELAPEVETALHFEIGLAFEAAGDLDEALAAYGAVARIDPAYRDVRTAIARMVAAGATPRPLEPSPASLGLRTGSH